eukprot:354798-Chlamydomonas_euryale.AAC.3
MSPPHLTTHTPACKSAPILPCCLRCSAKQFEQAGKPAPILPCPSHRRAKQLVQLSPPPHGIRAGGRQAHTRPALSPPPQGKAARASGPRRVFRGFPGGHPCGSVRARRGEAGG